MARAGLQGVALAGLGVWALSGCSIGRHDTAVQATTDLVGISKADLYQCAGVPDRTAIVDGVEYVTFDNTEETTQSLTIPLIGGGASNQATQFCRTTASLVNGKVTAISYTGDTGAFYARDEQCAYSIATCVKGVEERRKQSIPSR
jgi:hypothetical protein